MKITHERISFHRHPFGVQSTLSLVSAILLVAFINSSFAQLYWDANGATAGTGGTGNWNTADTNWNDVLGTGSPQVWANSSTSGAVFLGTGGAVTINTTGIQANALIFRSNGFTISGSASNNLTLAGTNPYIDVESGITGIISSAQLAGSSGLEKRGDGTLWIQSATALSGGLTISGGSLRLGTTGTSNPSSFITGNSVTLSGGTLEIYASTSANSVVAMNSLSIAGSSAISVNRTATSGAASISTNFGSMPVTMNGTLTWSVSGNVLSTNTELSNYVLTLGTVNLTGNSVLSPFGNSTFSTNMRIGAVSESVGGPKSLTKTGGGNLRFDGNNTYSGTTFISEGLVYLSASGNLSPNSALVMNPSQGSSASLNLSTNGPHTETIGSLASSGAGVSSLVLGSSSLTVGGDNSSTTFSGVISGSAGSLIKVGSGTLTLTEDNSFGSTGGLFVQEGTLRVSQVSALSSSASPASPRIFLRGGVLMVDASGNSSVNRGFHIGPLGASGSATINVSEGNQFAILGVIENSVGGNGRIIKLGQGTLRLQDSVNTFTGGISIQEGALSVGIDSRLGAVPLAPTPGHLLIDGGRLLATASFTVNSNRGIAIGPQSGTGLGTIEVASGATLTYAGIIANNGAGVGRLVKSGEGVLRLETNANTFTGGLSVLAGTLSFSQDSRLGAAPATPTQGHLLLNGGVLLYTLNATQTINANRGIALGPDTGSGGGFINVNPNLTLTYNGIMTNNGSGTGSFQKLGNGILSLGGSSTYTGTTTVSAGTLLINGNQSLATGNVSVTAGATLGGTGIVGGATTILGTHSPGSSAGLQTFVSDLTYDGGSSFFWELFSNTDSVSNRGAAAGWDAVNVAGNLAFINPVSLTLSFNESGSAVNWTDALWSSNRQWLVWSHTGLGTTSGLGNLFISTQNWLDSAGNGFNSRLAGSYFDVFQSGQDVYLRFNLVPEPSRAVLLLAGALGLGARRRRRIERRG